MSGANITKAHANVRTRCVVLPKILNEFLVCFEDLFNVEEYFVAFELVDDCKPLVGALGPQRSSNDLYNRPKRFHVRLFAANKLLDRVFSSLIIRLVL